MNLVFVQPSWLWLLLLVPLFWFLPHRVINRTHAAIRSVLASLLIFALTRPALITNQDQPYQVIVWDRSESVGTSMTTAVEGLVERLPDTSQVRVVTLNGTQKNVPKVGKLEPVNLSGSSVSQALAVGARLIPEGAVGALTLFGDGMATDRNWGDAVRQLVERKIPVNTVTVTVAENEVYPSAIRTRPPLRVGQTTKLMVDVTGSARQAVVTLWSGEELLARSAPLVCGGRTTVELEFEPSQAGLLDVVARVQVVSGSDINPDNNQFMSTLAVQKPIQALYLAERLTNSREKMSDLLGPGVDLSEPSLAQLEKLADNPRRIAAYDLVVIDDRPAETIPLPVQEAIVKAVKEDGVGLFYAGGKGVFGTGGYFDTPVASVLPVEMIQKEEKRDPSTTLVVIIDTSGSMTGERVQLAKECARLAIRRLLPHDKVGIVEFYGTKQWAAPIQSAANSIDIQRALNRLDAGGGTVILPAIEEAFYAMQNVQTRYKHVLVLTDGGVESGDFESLMRRMAAKGINVSTVLVGSNAHSEFLVNIANWGKGHFYCASSRFSIPEVLLKQPSTSKIPPYRPGSHLVSMGGPSGWWGKIPRPEEPKLSGYVETCLRPGAQIVVETETARHPILASWRYGLGRISAFTTEPVGDGTAPWREWDGYGAWLLRVLSRTSREHPQPFAYTIERSRIHARIVAQRLIPQLYRPQAERLDVDGIADRLVFQQRSPDVFTATILEDPGKTIHLRARAEGWPGSMAHLVSPAWHAVAPEHNVDPARAVDLSLLASATGGRNVSLENIAGLDPATGGTGTAKDIYRLWPWCLILGLLAYFSDLLFRRWPGSMAVGVKKLALLWLVIGFGFVSAADVSAGLSIDLEVQLQDTLKEDPSRIDDGLLYRAALLEDEALEPLLARLNAIIKDNEKAFGAIWLAASLQWRYGNLDEALRLFEKAAAIKAEPLVLFRVAQLLDAGGKTAEAVEQYMKTLEAKPDDALAERIQLRLAILKSTGTRVAKDEEDLATYAMGRDQVFQNRAGVVLALAGKPKEAIALYKPAEDGNQRFKQLIRIAEWAMVAKDMARAQESAWGALRAARLKRDRRYALTVLAESHRRDKKLDQLIERFAATPDLSAEARMAWIDLLREQGDADKALALFQEAKAGGSDVFTADMRRELLEICREAGRDDLLIENFRKMIATEPRRLEWRSGLCRFYLECGERDKGKAVWADYQQQTHRSDWLAAAGAIMELGLDGLAQSFAENLIRASEGKEQLAALQFLFDLHKARGREDDMRAVLERMDELAAPDASERARLAESWEQLGRQDKAAQVLEKLRAARGPEDVSSDLETRLAWLYSETGAEEKAYEAWKRAWLHIDSPGRRRYIEDRLMATASRLGKLADIAIELEENLADGTADKRDSALLVRLYTKVGDPVSASEIIHDFMKLSGGAEIHMLEEQALVYVMCNDYYHYEKTLRKLMQLDPEGSPEYLTQLAMSALERGRNDEARAILTEMRGLETNPASAEFEAGVLKIAGMHKEAAGAYWRGIAQHPDRIDAYLLLGQTLQVLGKGQQAVGLFQYLVENADEDDLFTIAIDGLLNMNNPRQDSQLPPETLLWARRAILERLAGKDDKIYLYQLLRDVSEDLRDRDMMIRALAETLPIAGEQRTTQLRELMELARSRPVDREGILRYGRRLVGVGEIMPPQIYLDLGSVFLESGDIRNAVKTFDKANGGLEHDAYQRKVAAAFEKKRYIRSALRVYEKLLITEPDNVGVLVKVGELKEQLGRDAEAAIAYRRALDVLIGGQPLFSVKGDKSAASGSRYYYSRNVGRFDMYYLRVLLGFLAASDPGGKAVLKLIDDSLEALGTDLEWVHKERAAAKNTEAATLANVPRIARRSRLIRRLALADGHLAKAHAMEELLLKAFPEDKALLPDICSTWDSWGYNRRARDIVSAVSANLGREEAWQVLDEGDNGGARQVFRLILNGDRAGARARLHDLENVLGERGTLEEINLLFTITRFLEDPAAAERLARFLINKTPGDQKLLQSIQMLTRAFPYLDERQRARLIAHVESLLERQGGTGAKGVLIYHYSRLKQFTGKDLKLPLTIIRPEVEKLLAKGSLYTRYMASMFSYLNEEDFRNLLREIYPKAASSDRLAIVFRLIRQYPGKMDVATEGMFIELAEEAASKAMGDPLSIYKTNIQHRYLDIGDEANAGLEARLLEKFVEGGPQDKRMDYLVEQIRVWHRAGNTEKGLEVAGKAFALALKKQKTFSDALALLREFPPAYFEAFLSVLDSAEKENGQSVDLEHKRIALARQARNPDRLLTVLRQSIRKFPKESAFYRELRKELEKLGCYYEAIEILESLAEIEPDNQKHRTDLKAAWKRLAHPIKASAAVNEVYTPKPSVRENATRPVSRTVSSRTSRTRPSMTTRTVKTTGAVKTAGQDNKEKPMEQTSTRLIKKLYEAGEIEAASLRLRDLWRRFSALDQSSRSRVFRRPSAAHSRYYEWPGQTSRPVKKSKPPASPESALGGLKAFLAMEPLTSPYGRPANPAPPSVFSAIGSEEFAARELRTWLRTFEPQNYQTPIFKEILREVVKQRISEQGVEPYVKDLIARHTRGELSALDQHALLSALELYPEAGGEAADLFMDAQLETLDPDNLWKMVRMAQCFLKRGNEEAALAIYQWCGADFSHWSNFSYGSQSVNPAVLVEEIRKNFDGASRVRILGKVLPLMTPNSHGSSLQRWSPHFILSTWAREVRPHEVYQWCPEICREVVRANGTEWDKHYETLELATLFLAAGGNAEEALNGLKLLLEPQPSTRISRFRNRKPSREYLLQQWLPEDMTNWIHADQWLSGIVERVGQWETERKLPTADAVKIMSLVAVRQHQNGFEDSARATLTEIGKLSLTNPDAAIWFIDAAEITGNQKLARKVATTLLKQRRLPIIRIAPLMEMVAEQQGVPTALQLAEKTLEYTWEPGFLQTMTKICTDAGDEAAAQLWKDRQQQVQKPGYTPAAAVVKKAEDDYRQLQKTSEAKQHGKALELGEAFLVAHPDHPKIAKALHMAAKAGIESMNFKRAVPLFRRILKEHPDFDAIDEVRFKLAQSLSGMRALEECITQCRENLKAAPESPGADYWYFLIPHSQFRLWRFKEAEKGLKDFLASHPGSPYAEYARRYLEKINPSWKVDDSGIGEYSGKYNEDYRFKAAMAALPDHIKEGYEKIRERLGVNIDIKGNLNFIFRDAGPDKQGGLMASTFTISRNYKPVTVVQFYAEHVVIDPEGYRKTVIHEMKHAGFRTLMGKSYSDLPDWIIEGLAQWAADQLEGRIVSKLTSETFAGKHPLAQMNGVANPIHDVGDYLEDVLAFEWLEKQKKGNITAFGKGLIKGDPWQKLLAATSGLDTDEALSQIDRYCLNRVTAELGPAGHQALALRDTFFAKGSEDADALNTWLREEGNRLFAEWVDKYPGHVLEPVVRFYSGRGLILTGSYAQGREWLRGVIDSTEGGSLRDDALFWEGYAFQQEKRMADAARSFGVLLRDYSWSNSAQKVRGKFKPAGPELNPSSHTRETDP